MKEGEWKVPVPGLSWYTETPKRRFTPLNSERAEACSRLGPGSLNRSRPLLYYCCPGLRYVASPALRIASTPSSALSSTVVLAVLR